MKSLFSFAAALLCLQSFAQTVSKKPLTHAVYDGWKSVGERALSHDGRIAVYAINPQEGDGELYVRDLSSGKVTIIQRGYGAQITADGKYVICKIRAKFQDTRQAKIKKKKPDEMPKDSIAVVLAGTDSVTRYANMKGFKMPERSGSFFARHAEKVTDSLKRVSKPLMMRTDSLVRIADSLIRRSLDSVKGNLTREEFSEIVEKAVKSIYKQGKDGEEIADAEGDDASSGDKAPEGTTLILQNLQTGTERSFALVTQYAFDKDGTKLFMSTSKPSKDSTAKAFALIHHVASGRTDTLMKGFNDLKSAVFDESGMQLAYVAERDSSAKALQKFYRLYYWRADKDTASVLAERETAGIVKGFSISENAQLSFSKNGLKLFFGTAAIKAPKDTTKYDFETAKLDIWTYQDDYLQTQQLKQLNNELKRSFTAVAWLNENKIVQLGTDSSEIITMINEGNSDYVLAQSTKGNRIAAQWEGRALINGYLIDQKNGAAKIIVRASSGNLSPSPNGKFVTWYDRKQRHYFAYNVATGETKNISQKYKFPLYDTDNDVPDLPPAAGSAGWTEDDRRFWVYDEFDIVALDPAGVADPISITYGLGRTKNTELRYQRLDTLMRFFSEGDTLLMRGLDKGTKHGSLYYTVVGQRINPTKIMEGAYGFGQIIKAKNAQRLLYQRGDISASELFARRHAAAEEKLTEISKQQEPYNWVTAELVKWKMFDGKMSEGLLFKPENFDSTKKYPVIFYFYERNSDQLYNYRAPAPSASTINIPYFVSNGYLVFDPNIYYKTGQPGESAYNSVVSAAKFLSKFKWVDSTRMAIQGQSWGGYQVAYLVTRTNLFRAAGAGAPVANMTSAYGGIRWEGGINRQFQYEKQQSRIGATLWEKPELYIKNSPLFAADKIQTPLLIMHNDADGAVPWYQSIELFTAMKRLNKRVWFLEYNGEDHNLVERRNRKDLSVRLGQYFDHFLKDAPQPAWMKYGVPATKKGIDWGLNVEEAEALKISETGSR